MLDIYELPLCNLVFNHHFKAISIKGMHLNRVITSITTLVRNFFELFTKDRPIKYARAGQKCRDWIFYQVNFL